MTLNADEAANSANRHWVNHSEDPQQQECTNCGGHITTDFARVFGDRDDIVHACLNCATHREIKSGAAAGFEVML